MSIWSLLCLSLCFLFFLLHVVSMYVPFTIVVMRFCLCQCQSSSQSIYIYPSILFFLSCFAFRSCTIQIHSFYGLHSRGQCSRYLYCLNFNSLLLDRDMTAYNNIQNAVLPDYVDSRSVISFSMPEPPRRKLHNKG